MKQPDLYVVHAAAVRDAAGVDARPGSVLIRGDRVLAAGDPASLPAELVAKAKVIDRPNELLLPAMVNAHTHLELTDIGPQPYEPAGGFMGWVKMLRERQQVFEANRSSRGIASVKLGKEQLELSGVQAVGDIATITGYAHLLGHRLAGVTYVELFGLGPPFDSAALETIHGKAQGLQPHAPYSAGPAVFVAAARSGRPVSTHLAESRDEHAFVSALKGPYLDYLREIGRWDDTFSEHYGQGLSPVQWMRPYLEDAADAGGWLVAHCNYVSNDDIQLLADTNTSVAYCPIASEYFGHKDHRYRDMLAAGVNVCLGTDSIVGTDPDDPQPLGLLSAIRRLYQRDGTGPATLLAMATTHGAKALRLPANSATLQGGAAAQFACIAIDADDPAEPLLQALNNNAPIKALSSDAVKYSS